LRQAAEKSYSGTFVFDPRDPIFADHFPGNPIVPGSLIVQAFFRAIQELEINGGYSRVERFRFKRFIQPGQYAFLLVQTNDGCLSCTLKEGSTTVATGRLLRQSGSEGEDNDLGIAPQVNGSRGSQ
jgi:3-hydroxyacyl-[acyl-carrier-protein] dehydratase